MIRRIIRAIRIDIADARTAIEMRDWPAVLPACIFRRIFK